MSNISDLTGLSDRLRRVLLRALLMSLGSVALASVAAGQSSDPAPMVSVVHAPLVIRQGGSYSGSWSSADSEIPAVTVATTEPVILLHCYVSGEGHLIRSTVAGSDITVRHCQGRGLRPRQAHATHGRFVAVWKPSRLVVENNRLDSTAGIYADGGGTAPRHISIQRNLALNIEGRRSDGRSGYLRESGKLQFLQLNNLRAAPDITVAWNEVINELWRSRVEDVISVHRSSGTPQRPIRIHDNFLLGAYPAEPLTESFSGGGIIIDGSSTGDGTESGHALIADNQVHSTTNYGIAIAAGVAVTVEGNRVFSPGTIPDGRRLAAANIGIYVWDVYGDRRRGLAFGRHRVATNVVAWTNARGQRNDHWFADCQDSTCTETPSAQWLPEAPAIESERKLWQRKLAMAGIRLGPLPRP